MSSEYELPRIRKGHADCRCSRRQLIRSFAASSMLFPGLLHELLADDAVGDDPADPLSPRSSHFPAKAKHVIFLFMTGGVSHVDTFDPKPKLHADVGKEVKLDHPEIENRPGYERIFLKRPQWEFQPHGQSGTEVSTLFPHVAGCVDDIALIRSMQFTCPTNVAVSANASPPMPWSAPQ